MPGTRVATPAVIAGENAKISDVVPEQPVKHNRRLHELLLKRAKEPLDDTIRFRLADERVAGGHAPEADLVVEMFGEERAAVVVSQRHAASGTGADVTEGIADRHADGL